MVDKEPLCFCMWWSCWYSLNSRRLIEVQSILSFPGAGMLLAEGTDLRLAGSSVAAIEECLVQSEYNLFKFFLPQPPFLQSGLAVSIKEAGGMVDGYEPSISVDSLSNPMLGIINKCCRNWVFQHISVALLWCTNENVLSQHPHNLLFYWLIPSTHYVNVCLSSQVH